MGSEKNGGETKRMNEEKKGMHFTSRKNLIGGYLVGGIIGFVTVVMILGVYWNQ